MILFCSGEGPALYQVLAEHRGVTGGMMASTHVYDMTGAGGAQPPAAIGIHIFYSFLVEA
jgi:hypothetical protein